MSAISSSLSVAQRLTQVLDHLGLPRAHFALRHPVDVIGLLEHARERVASVVLQGVTGRAEPFAPVAARTLWLLGDAGPTGKMRARLEALPNAVVHWIEGYSEFMWSDTAVDHAEEMTSAMLGFLQGMDQHDACPAVTLSGAGEAAGVSYAAAGSGSPVVLLPLGLASRQWEPVLPRLQAHHCTIVLGGKYLQPVELLEARAQGDYARMALHLLDLAKPRASDALVEVGCGTGALLRRIVRHTGMSRVTGLDINAFLLKEARALAALEGLGDRLRLEEGSAEALPFPDNAFDVVYSCTVMEEVNADRMLAELVRIAKPGGRVAVGVRAIDRGMWTNLPLAAPLKEKIERFVGTASMHAEGCADESLYRRFHGAGLQAIEGGPAWAWARPADAWWRNNQAQQIRGMLTPAEDEVWLRTLRQAQADGLPVWFARPFHCAVGAKP